MKKNAMKVSNTAIELKLATEFASVSPFLQPELMKQT